jgi:hypothetical protein
MATHANNAIKALAATRGEKMFLIIAWILAAACFAKYAGAFVSTPEIFDRRGKFSADGDDDR